MNLCKQKKTIYNDLLKYLIRSNYTMEFVISAGIIGVVCLILSVRLAHASLEHKLKPRRAVQEATPTLVKVSTYIYHMAYLVLPYLYLYILHTSTIVQQVRSSWKSIGK